MNVFEEPSRLAATIELAPLPPGEHKKLCAHRVSPTLGI